MFIKVKYWFKGNNKPILVKSAPGDSYIIEGNRHREDGPAVEGSDGWQVWAVNDNYHRLDGPAIVPAEADNEKVWYIKGKFFKEDIFNSWNLRVKKIYIHTFPYKRKPNEEPI